MRRKLVLPAQKKTPKKRNEKNIFKLKKKKTSTATAV